MVIRHEKFSKLIWSDKDKGYFIPNNEQINEEVNKILQKDNKVDKEILKEMQMMGLDDNVKEIYCNNEELSTPLEYYFDFTDACNLQCNHCYNREQLLKKYFYASEILQKETKKLKIREGCVQER